MSPTPPRFVPALDAKAIDRVWSRLANPSRAAARPWLWVSLVAAVCSALAVGVVAARGLVAPFTDGSVFEPMTAGSEVTVVASTATHVVARQVDGSTRYRLAGDVARQWSIETPHGMLESQGGAAFTLKVSSEGLEVEVETGSVLVHRGTVSRTALAGESIRLEPVRPDGQEAIRPALSPAPSPPPVEQPPAPAPLVAPSRAGSPRPPAPMTASEILVQAEAALAAHQPDVASLRLTRWLGAAPRTNEWAVVALRLGTIELEHRRSPRVALEWFDEVQTVGAPPSAIEDAAALRVVALQALGRPEEAEQALTVFGAQFPESAWLPTLGQGSKR